MVVIKLHSWSLPKRFTGESGESKNAGSLVRGLTYKGITVEKKKSRSLPQDTNNLYWSTPKGKQEISEEIAR